MIKIEVFYKNTAQAPEYFEVESLDNYCTEGVSLYVTTYKPFKSAIIPMDNVLRVDIEEFEKDDL